MYDCKYPFISTYLIADWTFWNFFPLCSSYQSSTRIQWTVAFQLKHRRGQRSSCWQKFGAILERGSRTRILCLLLLWLFLHKLVLLMDVCSKGLYNILTKNNDMLEYLLEFWWHTCLSNVWSPFCFSIFSNPFICSTMFFLNNYEFSATYILSFFSSWLKKNSSKRSRDFVDELHILALDVKILLNPIVNNFY